MRAELRPQRHELLRRPQTPGRARDVPAPPAAWWFVRAWRDGLEPSGDDELAAGRPDCDAGAVGDQWDFCPRSVFRVMSAWPVVETFALPSALPAAEKTTVLPASERTR